MRQEIFKIWVCPFSILQAEDTTKALEESKALTNQALANVAYQIHTLAASVLRLLDAHTIQLMQMESSVNILSMVGFNAEDTLKEITFQCPDKINIGLYVKVYILTRSIVLFKYLTIDPGARDGSVIHYLHCCMFQYPPLLFSLEEISVTVFIH